MTLIKTSKSLKPGQKITREEQNISFADVVILIYPYFKAHSHSWQTHRAAYGLLVQLLVLRVRHDVGGAGSQEPVLGGGEIGGDVRDNVLCRLRPRPELNPGS